ncbi:MAG: hypothetical protein JO000_25770 [Alphaproteobacteria bacterium]|nr:hypothetical protein [Alphaproteobacteria bacterium]
MFSPPTRLVTILRLCALLAAFSFLPLTSPAQALEFRCIEASKYRNLMRIFGEDPEALLGYFGAPGAMRPAPDACRAMLVTGALVSGDAKKLLGAIVENKGWLAALYLAHSGSNPQEEIKIASIIRGFWLKTFQSGPNPKPYEPDFIVRSIRVGPSATAAWEPWAPSNHPLQAGLADYLRTVDRRLPDAAAAQECTESCISFFVAGVDRLSLNPGTIALNRRNANDAMGEVRQALRRWLDETAAAAPSDSSLPRLPAIATQALRAECALEIDANLGAQEQVRHSIEDLAKGKFDRFVRIERVLPRFNALQTTMTRLQTCLARAHDRKRVAQLKAHCANACDVDAIDAAFTDRTADLLGAWTPSRAG